MYRPVIEGTIKILGDVFGSLVISEVLKVRGPGRALWVCPVGVSWRDCRPSPTPSPPPRKPEDQPGALPPFGVGPNRGRSPGTPPHSALGGSSKISSGWGRAEAPSGDREGPPMEETRRGPRR